MALLVAFAVVIATGCSGRQSQSLLLPESRTISRLNESEPYVHVIKTQNGKTENSASGNQKLFFTAIKNCNEKKYQPDVASVVRKLFAGFKNVRVEKSVYTTIGDFRATRSNISCTENGKPLKMVSYVVDQNNCLTDLVFWHIDGSNVKELQPSLLHEVLDQANKENS
jgi:hypothetical protein